MDSVITLYFRTSDVIDGPEDNFDAPVVRGSMSLLLALILSSDLSKDPETSASFKKKLGPRGVSIIRLDLTTLRDRDFRISEAADSEIDVMLESLPNW